MSLGSHRYIEVEMRDLSGIFLYKGCHVLWGAWVKLAKFLGVIDDTCDMVYAFIAIGESYEYFGYRLHLNAGADGFG